MVSFSCENCGDVLTKKKLDGHRNQCYGASYTCLDCMIHFEGTSYRSHTSCISEDQKYQGKLYRGDKKKPQHQKKDSAQNSQALVPRTPYVEDAPDADNGAVAIVDAPPRAPTPPPATNSLGYGETAALPPVNVFDFLDESATPNPSRTHLPLEESRMIEDSQPPAYEERPQPAVEQVTDVMKFMVPDDSFGENGFAYGEEPVRPTNERYDSSYNMRNQAPDFNFTTPAPKSKHGRTKSKDITSTITKEERKRKRNSPAELDMTLVRAQHQRDLNMADTPPVLHSGLTGGLNRLLTRPEFPPSPEYSGEYVENSPLSPMKRAKQGASKAFLRAQKDFETQQERERKAELKQEKKERGRDRERKERKVSTALVKIKPKMKKREREDSGRDSQRARDGDRRRRRHYTSSTSPARERKPVKAIEYRRSGSRSPGPHNNSQLIVRPNGDLAPLKTEVDARAELFMSFINKGPDSERGMSVNKALKRYHRERYDSYDRGASKADEEKELWKSMRLKRNDRGEVVLFFAPESA